MYKKDFVDASLEAAPTTPGMKYKHYSPNAAVSDNLNGFDMSCCLVLHKCSHVMYKHYSSNAAVSDKLGRCVLTCRRHKMLA